MPPTPEGSAQPRNNGKEPDKLHYSIDGKVVLKFEVAWANVARLKKHPGKGFNIYYAGDDVSDDGNPESWEEVKECTLEFQVAFFQCLDDIIMYFERFAESDKIIDQAVWFRMLDNLLKVGNELPHGHIQMDSEIGLPKCSHADKFQEMYDTAIDYLNDKLTDRTINAERVVSKRGHQDPDRLYSAGPGFKSGLKPWQQFLFNNSPGFTVAPHEQMHIDTEPPESNKIVRVQHIPPAGVGIIQANQDEWGETLEKMAEEEPEKYGDELEDYQNYRVS
jgi:hypothetical protein